MFGAEPKRINGARALLFDRLFDDARHQSAEAVPARIYSREELRHSVLREIARLVSTRCPLPFEEARQAPRTVLNYGIPDHAHLSPFREEDRKSLGLAIQQAIAVYEPRLLNARVEAVMRVSERRLQYKVTGDLIHDSVMEPLAFELEVEDRHSSPVLSSPQMAASECGEGET